MTTVTKHRTAEQSVALSRVVRADWALWVDWCTATDRDPHHGAIPDLTAFLLELPASPGVQDRRIRSIARTLTGTGHTLPRPTTAVPVRLGPQWAKHADALAALHQGWYPEGVAARRDALILTLTAAGFTRTLITTLRPAQIDVFPDAVVDCVELPRHTDPVQCPRCALVRWLQVLDAFKDRSRLDIEDLLANARDHSRPRHECQALAQDGWRRTPWVIPAIDRWGAIQPGTPITSRGITAILARRHDAATVHAAIARDEQPTRPVPEAARQTGRRPRQEEHQEISRSWDKVAAEADALNARIDALLAEL